MPNICSSVPCLEKLPPLGSRRAADTARWRERLHHGAAVYPVEVDDPAALSRARADERRAQVQDQGFCFGHVRPSHMVRMIRAIGAMIVMVPRNFICTSIRFRLCGKPWRARPIGRGGLAQSTAHRDATHRRRIAACASGHHRIRCKKRTGRLFDSNEVGHGRTPQRSSAALRLS